MNTGIIWGTIGGLLGVIGGIIGTYFSIKNTEGPMEKAFMIKASVIVWVAVTLFIVLLLVVPSPYKLWLWVPYGILLPLGIIKLNKRVSEIRATENSKE